MADRTTDRIRHHLERAEALAVLMGDVIEVSNPLICGDDMEGEQYRDMIKTYAAAIQAHASIAEAYGVTWNDEPSGLPGPLECLYGPAIRHAPHGDCPGALMDTP